MAILRSGVTDRIFPGAQLCVTHRGKVVCHTATGNFTYETDSSPVTVSTIYDVASLTKVMATTAMAMALYQEAKLDLDEPVVDQLTEFAASEDIRHAFITARMLLAHTSGLPGVINLYERCFLPNEVLEAVHRMPLVTDPGKKMEYSDVGFILLGELLQRISGERLDQFCEKRFYQPLGMWHTRFKPPVEWKQNIPPTENEKHYRRRVIQGEVHDENAAALGGVGGHAGLFSMASEVARFALCMLNAGEPIFQQPTVELFTSRSSVRKVSPPESSRALGWDTPSPPSSSGRFFSTRAFGHLGFTGASLWIDPEHDLSVTLLCNRTWPDRSESSSSGIRKLRPAIHDAVFQSIQQS